MKYDYIDDQLDQHHLYIYNNTPRCMTCGSDEWENDDTCNECKKYCELYEKEINYEFA